MRPRRSRWIAAVLPVALLLAACGSSDDDSSSKTSTSNGGGTSTELTKVKLALPWYPIPEFGGAFAALQQGYFEEVGVDMEIQSGSPQVSVTQLVGVGQADMAFSNTDNNLVLARQEGVPLKGVATTFQTYPGSAVYHADNPIDSPEDLNGRNFYSVPGQFDTDWLVSKYGLDDIKQNTFSPQAFIADEDGVLVTWSFNIAAELDKQGLEWDEVRIADTGYNSYALVLITSDSFLEKNRELVTGIVEAISRGWDYYRENYSEVNKFMYDFDDSKTMSPEAMDATAQRQEDYYVADDQPFSTIDPERFEGRLELMREHELLTKDLTVDDLLDLTVNPAQP